MSRYIVAPSAVADLDEIWLYIAPTIGRHRPNLGEDMRSFPVHNYRIYYRQDSRHRVRILHVKHSARDEKKLVG